MQVSRITMSVGILICSTLVLSFLICLTNLDVAISPIFSTGCFTYDKDGFIIERDKYYIFHPNELTDKNAPLKYRYLENFVNKK